MKQDIMHKNLHSKSLSNFVTLTTISASCCYYFFIGNQFQCKEDIHLFLSFAQYSKLTYN